MIIALFQVANQVLNGEGVGWLRVGRLKKLFEDEGYRASAVAKLNKTLDRKIGPDDHIDDVVSLRYNVYDTKPNLFNKLFKFLSLYKVHIKTSVERNVEVAPDSCGWTRIQLC